jgi:uncharacterized protein (DUF1697 family)
MSVQMFAFIRAINTGGRRLTNEALLEPFHAAGLDGVGAYQAAGNVVFRTSRDPHEVESTLAALLTEAYGFDSPTFVRTGDELRTCLAAMPFGPKELTATQGRVQITFMATAPTKPKVAAAHELVPAEDLVEFIGREWFWLPRAGISDSALPVARIERIVGPMTMRTVGTIERMLAKYPG